MEQEIVIRWGDDLNDVLEKRVRAAVAGVVGEVYGECRDRDTARIVLRHAEFAIEAEMRELLREVEYHSLVLIVDETQEEGEVTSNG